ALSMMRAGSVVGRSITSPKTFICLGSASSGLVSSQNASKSTNFATVPPPKVRKGRSTKPRPHLRFGNDIDNVTADGQRRVVSRHIVTASRRDSDRRRRFEFDAVPELVHDAEFAQALVANFLCQRPQSHIAGRFLSRFRIDKRFDCHRELIAALGYDVPRTSSSPKMTRISVVFR